MKLVSGIVDSGFFAQSALSAEVATKDNLGRNISETYLTAVDLTPYQEKSAMSGYLTTGDSAQFYTNDNPSGFITTLPADLVYTGDLNDYAKKDFVNDSIDSATSGLLPTSSFSSVSSSFITALPSDLVYTADITGKLDTSVYATDSAMFSGAIDYVSANVGGSVSSPLGTILVNGSEIEATNSAINLTGARTPYTTATTVNISQDSEFYPLNFGTINTGSFLNISGFNGNTGNFYIIGNDSANNVITLQFTNQSGSLGKIVSGIYAILDRGATGNYNFELSSYTLGSGVDELAWKSEIVDLVNKEYLQANYQPQSAMTAYQPKGEMWHYLTTEDAFYNFQQKKDMSAYQPAGDYLTTADSAQFITALPADLVYTADITGFATTADLTSKLDKSDSAKFLLTGDSANFYTTANESGFITGIPSEVTDAASTVASNSANWNSTYNTVSTNSADWSVAEEISGTNGIKISESADKVIIEVSASYATEDWVTAQGYLTAHQDISNKLDTTAFSTVSGNFLTAVPTGYATEDWVTGQGYITGINYNTGSI